MMSELGTTSTRSHRPRRAPVKTSDDSILGISWKEERELRKAMYVSLRQRQRIHVKSSKTNSVKSAVVRSSKSNVVQVPYPFRWRSQRAANSRPAANVSRTAKLRATVRITGDSVARHCHRASSPTCLKNARVKQIQNSSANAVTRSRVRSPCPKNPISNRRSTRGGRSSNTSTAPETSVVCGSITCQSGSLLNSVIINSKSDSLHSVPKLVSSPTRSSGKSLSTPPTASKTCTSAFENTTNGTSSTPLKRNPPTPTKLKAPLITPSKSLGEGNQSSIHHVSSPSMPIVRPDRMLFSADNTCAPSVKHNSNTTPQKVFTDPTGKPVSVHDFVDFICYQGTPCLPKNLEWFNNRGVMPKSDPSSDTSSTSRTPTGPSQQISSVTGQRCSKRNSIDNPTCSSASAKLRVAKKMASSNPSIVHRSTSKSPASIHQSQSASEWKKPLAVSTTRMCAKRRTAVGSRRTSRLVRNT